MGKKYKRDKNITKLYKSFKVFIKELCNVIENKTSPEVCNTAADMYEKYIMDNLKAAKQGSLKTLVALRAAETEGKNLEIFNSEKRK